MTEENETLNSSNEQETSLEESTSVSDTTSEGEENTEDLGALREQNKKLFARAKKAEAMLKVNKTEVKEEPKPEKSSVEDVFIINSLGLSQEEYNELTEFAERKKISKLEASKHPFMTSFLKTVREEKATAQATSVGSSRKGVPRMTDESIVEDFQRGKMPDSKEGWQRLAEAEIALKKKASKRG